MAPQTVTSAKSLGRSFCLKSREIAVSFLRADVRSKERDP